VSLSRATTLAWTFPITRSGIFTRGEFFFFLNLIILIVTEAFFSCISLHGRHNLNFFPDKGLKIFWSKCKILSCYYSILIVITEDIFLPHFVICLANNATCAFYCEVFLTDRNVNYFCIFWVSHRDF
jgi:hypothetical protein